MNMAQKATAIDAIRKVPNWINGEVHESSSDRYGDVFDSATGERCAQVVMSDEADVDAAVAAAKAAFAGWSMRSRFPPAQELGRQSGAEESRIARR